MSALAEEPDPHLIARGFVEAPGEMPAAIKLAARRQLEFRYDRAELTASLALSGPSATEGSAEEPYLIVASFDDYPLLPPVWQFVDPKTGCDIGLPGYPRPVGASVIHPNGLVCAHWSRKAYQEEGGPHSNWGGARNWENPVEGSVALTIADMLDRLIREVGWSRGRMGALPQ
jgi:hypothetical protein